MQPVLSVKNLLISSAIMEPAAYGSMFDVMRKLPNLESLHLHNISCEAQTLELPDCPGLSRPIELVVKCGTFIDPLLLKLLQGTQLRKFSIRQYDFLPNEGAEPMASALLEHQGNLEVLEWGCEISKECIDILIDTARKNEGSLDSLSLAPWGWRPTETLFNFVQAQQLMELNGLRSLDLSCLRLPDDVLIPMIQSLGRNKNLYELALPSMHVTHKHFEYLRIALLENQTLTHLTVDWSPKGIKSLLGALEASNKTLQRVKCINMWGTSSNLSDVSDVSGASDSDESSVSEDFQLPGYTDWQALQACLLRNRRLQSKWLATWNARYVQAGVQLILNQQGFDAPADLAWQVGLTAYEAAPESALQLAALNKAAWTHAQQVKTRWNEAQDRLNQS